MGSSSFFNNPPVGDVIDEGGQGNSFYDESPAYTEIDPVAIEHFTSEAAASAAASEVSHQASLTSANASAASAAASHTSEVNAAASAAGALASKNSADADAATATTQAGIATTQATTATTQASTATTQAGIATTQAGIATTQAGNASTSASQALASKNAAATSETNAHTSEVNAASSATAAAGSASSAASAVATAVAALVNSAPSTLDTLNEIATALGNDPNFATTITTALGLKAPLASPALTGNPTAPTQSIGDNSTKLATTAFVLANSSGTGAVRYDITQSLSGPQQSQAQSNINAAPAFTLGNALALISGNLQVVSGSAASYNPANPTGVTTNATGVMMGIGSVVSFTPSRGSRLRITIDGSLLAATVNSFTTIQGIRYGTGTAPANGTALSGTVAGGATRAAYRGPLANSTTPFSVSSLVTGLTPGTTYWFDIGLSSTSGLGTASSINVVIEEII